MDKEKLKRILIRIGVFYGVAFIWVMVGVAIYPTDESNTILLPTWYTMAMCGSSALAAFLDMPVRAVKRIFSKDAATNQAVETVQEFPTAPVAEAVEETPMQPSDADRIIAALMDLKASIDGTSQGDQASTPNKALTPEQSVQYELLTIDLMEGHGFEVWCAEALKNRGFYNVSVTPGSGDQGVDVLAEKDGIKYAIQCKRYSSDLGNTPIQEVHSGKDFYHRHVGVVLTNQHFTEGAKQLASRTGTLLWDRNWIIGYLNVKYGVTQAEASSTSSAQPNDDDCYSAAVEVVLETGQASVSMLQRRLKLGYALAARLVDRMEAEGLVGPFRGSTPREILVTKEQWQKRIANK